jgi:polar amino acid transport system substrate-binding protein
MKTKLKSTLFVFFLVFSLFLFNNKSFAQNKKIVLASETSWPPHYGKDLPNGGYTTEISREALKRVGYELEIEWLPWKRALIEAAIGKYDGVGASYYNEERAKDFAFTDAIGKTEIVFFMLKGKNIRYSKLEDLKPYTIGVGRGYAYPDKFTSATYLKTEEAITIEHNIRKLLRHRIDLIIDSREVIPYLLQTYFPNNVNSLEMLEPPLDTLLLYVAFSKNSPNYKKKVEDFNRGLKMIKDDGTYGNILKKHGF